MKKVYNILITALVYKEVPFEPHQYCHRSIQTLLKTEVFSTDQKLAHRYSHTGSLQLPYVPYPICKNNGFLCASTCHGTLGSPSSLCNSSCHIESPRYPSPGQIDLTSIFKSMWLRTSRKICYILCFSCAESNTGLLPSKP